MITCSLTCHVLTRLFVPMIIGMMSIILISIIPLCIQNNDLAAVIDKQMSTLGKIGIEGKINNLAIQLSDLFKQIDRDIILLHNYSTECVNNIMPVRQYYNSYSGIEPIVPMIDKDKYSYSSSIYSSTLSTKYINTTSTIDNIYRSIFKSNNGMYKNIYIGLDDGLLRVYPFVSLLSLQLSNYDPRSTRWYTKSISNDGINYNTPVVNEFNAKLSIAICKSVRSNGTRIGVVCLNYDVTNIDTMVLNFNIT